MANGQRALRSDEVLDHAREGFVKVLAQAGVPGRDALAESLVASLHETLGGQQLYITMQHAAAVAAKHADLYRSFNGNNHADLAQRYKHSLRHVYRVIALCQFAEFQARQSTLI